jgi:hypothetical protein
MILSDVGRIIKLREAEMNEYLRKMIGRSLWGLLGVGLIIIIVWSLATHFLPDGWWITLINVLGFLSTAVIIFLGTLQALKLVISSGLAFLFALLIWAAMVIGLRSLIFSLLGD